MAVPPGVHRAYVEITFRPDASRNPFHGHRPGWTTHPSGEYGDHITKIATYTRDGAVAGGLEYRPGRRKPYTGCRCHPDGSDSRARFWHPAVAADWVEGRVEAAR